MSNPGSPYIAPQVTSPPFRFGIPTTEDDAVMRRVSDEDMLPPELEWQRSRTPRGAQRELERKRREAESAFGMGYAESSSVLVEIRRNDNFDAAVSAPTAPATTADRLSPLTTESQKLEGVGVTAAVEEALPDGTDGTAVRLSGPTPTVEDLQPPPVDSAAPACLKALAPDFLETVLSNKQLLEYNSTVFFKAYSDSERNLSTIDLRSFLPHLSAQLCLKEPSTEDFLMLFAKSDADCDGALSLAEFNTFLETALLHCKALGKREDTPRAKRW